MSVEGGPQYVGDIPDSNSVLRPKLIRLFNGSGSDIVRGSAVMEDLVATHGLGTAIKLATADAAGARGIIGGAWGNIPNGAWGLVILEGVQTEVSVIDGTTAPNDLSGSLTTAGRLIASPLTAGIRTVARLLAAPASNLATVRWLNPHAL